ncbi:MAG: SGNH/GDSL hydrolase family protein [Candidatus Sumerlaeota bacterium]|nr:SGNH/GDSL hydrolase family protein [Candidatus Sumerlaeota bacterium]
MATLINDNAVVLFQGDSITDCGRDRAVPSGLGAGYAMMVASWFSASYPCKRVTFLNRGISGDRVKDLRARWRKDCLDLKPAWVSIMIGINDTWRRYDRNDPTPATAYERDYRDILTQARDEAGARIVMLEPFVLPVPQDREAWREDLDPKIDAARRLAREFGAIYIPLDGLFAAASTQREPAFWAADGVHPSQAGHAFIAQQWLKAVSAI